MVAHAGECTSQPRVPFEYLIEKQDLLFMKDKTGTKHRTLKRKSSLSTFHRRRTTKKLACNNSVICLAPANYCHPHVLPQCPHEMMAKLILWLTCTNRCEERHLQDSPRQWTREKSEHRPLLTQLARNVKAISCWRPLKLLWHDWHNVHVRELQEWRGHKSGLIKLIRSEHMIDSHCAPGPPAKDGGVCEVGTNLVAWRRSAALTDNRLPPLIPSPVDLVTTATM